MKRLPSLASLVVLAFLARASVSYATDVPDASAKERASSINAPGNTNTIVIPGPLRSFLRMAAISQKSSQEEVLPLLTRNVIMQGYSQGRPTEFLLLLMRYVSQARELSTLAGGDAVLRVTNCGEAQPLLAVLGYRFRRQCGDAEATLETADADRAFLTIDSGFPLPELEHDLAQGRPFVYPFGASSVPVMFTEADWTRLSKNNPQKSRHLLDQLLRDPILSRLYWGLSRIDASTRTVMKSSIGLEKLMAHAAIVDFYGANISIHGGRVVVPGGVGAEKAWHELVGASPESAGDFVEHLISKDRGWMAAYFDVLTRAKPELQSYFADPSRLHPFYEALLASERTSDATTGVFRPAPKLLLLVTRLQRGADGHPLVPGNVHVWNEILKQKSDSNVLRKWKQRPGTITTPDDLIETLFALSRVRSDNGTLQSYLSLSEMDSRRSEQNRLSPETVQLLCRRYEVLGQQYRIFSEFPELNNESIRLFVTTALSLDAVTPIPLRGNALGTFQANVGLWQILARQQEIPSAQVNESWQAVIRPFAQIKNSSQLYEAGVASLRQLSRAVTGKDTFSQDEFVEYLAGPPQTDPESKRMHDEFTRRILMVLDGQRLVSLDTLITIGNALTEKANGAPVNDGILALAGELREFQQPQPIFSNSERTEWAAGIYNNSHTDSEMRSDVGKVLKSPASKAQALEAKGQLASFLRDSLVGLNYAYYEPPGAQILHHNPLLVRSHDFAAETVGGIEGVWGTPQMFGEGSPAGGGAHLVGSLSELPYVLAQIEQDFIAPENVQALIWRELVPTLLTSAVLPRWWGVSKEEMHAVALYQRAGEEILASSTKDAQLRDKVLDVLSERMSPVTLRELDARLQTVPDQAMASVSPADVFYLSVNFHERFPDAQPEGQANQELKTLKQGSSNTLEWNRLSRDFGVPHPVLAQTYARELLNLAPVPAFDGFASRLLAESWDSSNLYWARLLDEMGYAPVAMNKFVPELTRRMVEKVAASNFDDWPALLRAMRETGEEFRQTKAAARVPDSKDPENRSVLAGRE